MKMTESDIGKFVLFRGGGIGIIDEHDGRKHFYIKSDIFTTSERGIYHAGNCTPAWGPTDENAEKYKVERFITQEDNPEYFL